MWVCTGYVFEVLLGPGFSVAKLFPNSTWTFQNGPIPCLRVPLLLSPLFNQALCVSLVFECTSDSGIHTAPYVLALSSKPHHIYSLMRTAVRQPCCMHWMPRVCTSDFSKQEKNPFHSTIVHSFFFIAWRLSKCIFSKLLEPGVPSCGLEVLIIGSKTDDCVLTPYMSVKTFYLHQA